MKKRLQIESVALTVEIEPCEISAQGGGVRVTISKGPLALPLELGTAEAEWIAAALKDAAAVSKVSAEHAREWRRGPAG